MESGINVIQVPREPFLAHSQELFRFLISRIGSPWHRVLEVGCGPASVLPEWIYSINPKASLTQIDAQPQLIELAARHTPSSAVMQMLASDMHGIETGSQDILIAMSVFDQNSRAVLPKICGELKRVLREQGFFIYMHNEELNLPATAASMLASTDPPRLLLPSDAWRPDNDLDYCSADKSHVEQAIGRQPVEFGPLIQYLRGVFPQVYDQQLQVNTSGKVAVPFLGRCTVAVMEQIRSCVHRLREQYLLPLEDHSTSALLRSHIEEGMLPQGSGFRVVSSGVYEIRIKVNWRQCFAICPSEKFFVRGLSRFGYAAVAGPPARADCIQHLNNLPQAVEEELLMIGYQYGLVAQRE